jgi:hypothetical protein
MFYTATEANIAIIAALRATKGVYVDEHRKNEQTDSATHFAVLQIGEHQHVCPLPKAQHYGAWVTSLNPIYLEEGKAHLSTWSKHTLNQKGTTVGEAINAFNKEFKDSKWGKAEIVDVVII